MARIPQVTRTIQTTNANVLCLNIEEGEPFNVEVTIPRTYKNDKDMMKVIEPLVNTDTVKAVHIVHSEIVETLYGMSEQDFIDHATILPPRGADKDYTAPDTNDNNMEGYKSTIIFASKELSEKEKVKLKDTTNAVQLTDLIAEGIDHATILPPRGADEDYTEPDTNDNNMEG